MDICFWHCDLLQAPVRAAPMQCISGIYLGYNLPPFSINVQLDSKWEGKKSLFCISEECYTTTNTFLSFKRYIWFFRKINSDGQLLNTVIFLLAIHINPSNFCFKTNRALKYYKRSLILKKKCIAGPYVFQLRHSIKPPSLYIDTNTRTHPIQLHTYPLMTKPSEMAWWGTGGEEAGEDFIFYNRHAKYLLNKTFCSVFCFSVWGES